MEKLQAALEKARHSRGGNAASLDVRSASSARPDSAKYDALWNGLPSIPLSDPALIDNRVVTREANKNATPFDVMRTKILLQMRQNGWKRLAITSPMPNCGKTTMACNLALGLGRQNGLRAMLFDLDLKSPSLSTVLDYTPTHSISDVLTGDVPFADQAVRIGGNVAVSMANKEENDPTRILLSPHTEETLDRIQATYAPDIVIFDLPSVLVGDDTRAFLKNVDCALIIARANVTRYGHFDACEREIAEHTNVLGVVLNAFRQKDMQSHLE